MKKIGKEFLCCTFGALLFVFAINFIIAPLGLYNGGFVGIGQIARYSLENFLGFSIKAIDLAGVIYFLLNAPLVVLAYRAMSRLFLAKTVYTVILQTILLSITQIPTKTFTEDMLTACIIGGILAGAGVGIILRSGSSGGGQDILGIYFAKCCPGYSVGRITILINGFVYGCCAVLFDLEIVVYSLIYTIVMSVVIDRMHSQNINNVVIILTKKPHLEDFVIHKMHRGITVWEGIGGYTKQTINIGLVALSKYEFPALKHRLSEFDNDAFVIVAQGANILGNYEKRFDA